MVEITLTVLYADDPGEDIGAVARALTGELLGQAGVVYATARPTAVGLAAVGRLHGQRIYVDLGDSTVHGGELTGIARVAGDGFTVGGAPVDLARVVYLEVRPTAIPRAAEGP
jgi:hypothetical protein